MRQFVIEGQVFKNAGGDTLNFGHLQRNDENEAPKIPGMMDSERKSSPERYKKVKIKLLAVLCLFSLLGCDRPMGIEEKEKIYGKVAPVITASFASRMLKPGDTWKIYLQASDPDGDMNHIACTLLQPGKGEYFPGFIKIREENGKELSGFIYLNTLSREGTGWMNFLSVTLTLQIQDKAGHYSERIHFPLTFQGLFVQELPPEGFFREQDLGPIMIQLSPPDSG